MITNKVEGKTKVARKHNILHIKIILIPKLLIIKQKVNKTRLVDL